MHNPGPAPVNAARDSNATQLQGRAAPEPMPAVESPAPGRLPDTPAEALGRRTLSTAFVMIGPDGQLTVELHDGRVLVLRDVVMRPRDYCGVRVGDGPGKARFCGSYGEVAAARPGAR